MSARLAFGVSARGAAGASASRTAHAIECVEHFWLGAEPESERGDEHHVTPLEVFFDWSCNKPRPQQVFREPEHRTRTRDLRRDRPVISPAGIAGKKRLLRRVVPLATARNRFRPHRRGLNGVQKGRSPCGIRLQGRLPPVPPRAATTSPLDA